MPDYKLVRTWVRFPGTSKKDTYDYLTRAGQDKALIVRYTGDQGIYNEEAKCYCYSFHLKFTPEMFEDGIVPHELAPVYKIAERMVREDFVADESKIDAQWSKAIPGQYVDQGKVKE